MTTAEKKASVFGLEEDLNELLKMSAMSIAAMMRVLYWNQWV